MTKTWCRNSPSGATSEKQDKEEDGDYAGANEVVRPRTRPLVGGGGKLRVSELSEKELQVLRRPWNVTRATPWSIVSYLSNSICTLPRFQSSGGFLLIPPHLIHTISVVDSCSKASSTAASQDMARAPRGKKSSETLSHNQKIGEQETTPHSNCPCRRLSQTVWGMIAPLLLRLIFVC